MKTANYFLFKIFTIFLLLSYCGCQRKNQEISEPPSLEKTTVAELSGQIQLPGKITSTKDGAEMILIPKGEFIYGIDKPQRDRLLEELSTAKLELFETEFPCQTKSLPAFYIDAVEVTNEQYARFMKETGHRPPRFWNDQRWNQPRQPVVGVGWADAEEYARWAGKRLPSEEEWEKAARGTDGRLWPWGNEPSSDKYNGKGQGNWATVTVGLFPSGQSPYGVMDTAGNVWEMTTGVWEGSSHAMRGGCYLNSGAYTRTMSRWAAENEEIGANWLGFRCVMDCSQIEKWAVVVD